MKRLVLILMLSLGALWACDSVWAFSADKVWMELRSNGRFRVWITYTVPEVLEFREVYAEFSTKKDAEEFFFNVVRGGDFHRPDSGSLEFVNADGLPTPW